MPIPKSSETGDSPRKRAPKKAPAAPAHAGRILSLALGGLPGRLYAAGADGSLQPIASSDLELDPRDPWTHELMTPRPWSKAPDDRTVELAALDTRPDLTAPDTSIRLRAVRDEGLLLGGVLVRVSDARALEALHRRLADPILAAGLAATLDMAGARRALDDLAGFREGMSEALPYGVLMLDPLGRVTFLSPRAATILGVSEGEAIGGDCARVFRPVGVETNPLLDGLRGRFKSGEIYVARPSGEEVPVSLQMALLPARGGRGRGLAVFFQDLSEERVLEETERQRDRLAALGELSAGVAHEIRNPLTGIANCAQVLSEGLDESDTRQRFLRIILEETARLNRIVEGLLRYARPSRPELREASVEELVRRALDLVRPSMEGKGIRINYTLAGRIPRIFLDPGQIEQVLLNLLHNAEQAMPAGGELAVSIAIVRRRPHRRRGLGRRSTDRIRVGRRHDGPLVRFVQVRLADTGHGIPRELLTRIFNPFFTTRSKGTGLGLSLSQSIVREHGGFLTVRSVVNKGTVFHLDLPVERRHGERRKDLRSA